MHEAEEVTLLGRGMSKVMDWSGQAWQVELGMKKRTEMIKSLSFQILQHTVLGLVAAFVKSKARYLLDLYNDTLGHECGAHKDQGGISHKLQVRQNAVLRAAMRISAKDLCGTEYLCSKAGMPTMWNLLVQSASSFAFRTMAPRGDHKELATPILKLHEYKMQTRAATLDDIQQETDNMSFVKQGATISNLLPN